MWQAYLFPFTSPRSASVDPWSTYGYLPNRSASWYLHRFLDQLRDRSTCFATFSTVTDPLCRTTDPWRSLTIGMFFYMTTNISSTMCSWSPGRLWSLVRTSIAASRFRNRTVQAISLGVSLAAQGENLALLLCLGDSDKFEIAKAVASPLDKSCNS